MSSFIFASDLIRKEAVGVNVLIVFFQCEDEAKSSDVALPSRGLSVSHSVVPACL